MKGRLFFITLVFAVFVIPCALAAPGFISVWDTTLLSTGSSLDTQVSLPLVASGDYNFSVDWGDGNLNNITFYNDPNVTHTYVAPGIYNVIVNGNITGWSFNNNGDKLKLKEISQWGPLNLGNDGNYFYGAQSLTITAPDKHEQEINRI